MDLTISDRSVPRGGSFDLAYEFKNTGSRSAGPFDVAVLISESATLAPGSSAVRLDMAFMASLGAGETWRVSRRHALGPYSSGTYYLLLRVDVGDQVGESREDDNLKAFGVFTIE